MGYMPAPVGEPIALQRRAPHASQDQRRRWPHARGGQNGTIALPSRQAALEGAGPPDAPGPRLGLDGWFGFVKTWFRGGWHAAMGGGARPYSPPEPLDRTIYVRRSFPNVWAIANFAPPRAGNTDETINAHEEVATLPYSAVPFDSRRIGYYAFRHPFDRRVHADYVPRERWQVGSPVTGGAGRGATMIEPYFPRLTRRPETTSYGQTTTMLGGV